MRLRHSLTSLTLLCCACQAPDARPEGDPQPSDTVGEMPLELALPAREAGFVEIPERWVLIPAAEAGEARAGRARLSYRFAPASSTHLPLCLVFSGGPGVTSAMLQRAFRVTQTSSGLLAEVCHALFVDQRNTGFSYNLAQPLPDADHSFTLADSNPYGDAADFVWVLLELVRRHPDLARLPLLIFGESYGGVRATLIADLLLHPGAYRNGERPVTDDALLDRLEEAELAGSPSRWLRGQVLVQPTLAGTRQDAASGRLFEAPDSVVMELARELSVTFSPCADDGCLPYFNALNQVEAWGRSAYRYPDPSGWLERKVAQVIERSNTREGLTELLTVDPHLVPLLGSSERAEAWRLARPDPEVPDSRWAVEELGPLVERDRYFLPFNTAVFVAFTSEAASSIGLDWLAPGYVAHFLENVRELPTFVTRASFDLVNYSPGLLLSLAESAGVANLTVETSESGPRGGSLELEFDDGERVVIRSPSYQAGHGVVGDVGPELVHDVAEWLEGL